MHVARDDLVQILKPFVADAQALSKSKLRLFLLLDNVNVLEQVLVHLPRDCEVVRANTAGPNDNIALLCRREQLLRLLPRYILELGVHDHSLHIGLAALLVLPVLLPQPRIRLRFVAVIAVPARGIRPILVAEVGATSRQINGHLLKLDIDHTALHGLPLSHALLGTLHAAITQHADGDEARKASVQAARDASAHGPQHFGLHKHPATQRLLVLARCHDKQLLDRRARAGSTTLGVRALEFVANVIERLSAPGGTGHGTGIDFTTDLFRICVEVEFVEHLGASRQILHGLRGAAFVDLVLLHIERVHCNLPRVRVAFRVNAGRVQHVHIGASRLNVRVLCGTHNKESRCVFKHFGSERALKVVAVGDSAIHALHGLHHRICLARAQSAHKLEHGRIVGIRPRAVHVDARNGNRFNKHAEEMLLQHIRGNLALQWVERDARDVRRVAIVEAAYFRKRILEHPTQRDGLAKQRRVLGIELGRPRRVAEYSSGRNGHNLNARVPEVAVAVREHTPQVLVHAICVHAVNANRNRIRLLVRNKRPEQLKALGASACIVVVRGEWDAVRAYPPAATAEAGQLDVVCNLAVGRKKHAKRRVVATANGQRQHARIRAEISLLVESVDFVVVLADVIMTVVVIRAAKKILVVVAVTVVRIASPAVSPPAVALLALRVPRSATLLLAPLLGRLWIGLHVNHCAQCGGRKACDSLPGLVEKTLADLVPQQRKQQACECQPHGLRPLRVPLALNLRFASAAHQALQLPAIRPVALRLPRHVNGHFQQSIALAADETQKLVRRAEGVPHVLCVD
eukprot:Opistho-2@74101